MHRSPQTNEEFPDDQIPETETDPTRSIGGDGSGLPPAPRVGTGLNDWELPSDAPDGGPLRKTPKLPNIFGIDFGDETTRIAGLLSGNPILIPSGVLATTVGMRAESKAWEAHGWTRNKVGMLRTRLRLGAETIIDECAFSASDLVTRFFRRVRVRLGEPPSTQVPRVVVTVPFGYGSDERRKLTDAIEAAGFEVLGLINSYAAPVLPLIQRGPARWGTILSLSLGANSLSAAILDCRNGSVSTLACAEDPRFSATKLMQEILMTFRDPEFQSGAETDEAGVLERVAEPDVALAALYAVAADDTTSSDLSDEGAKILQLLRKHLGSTKHLIGAVLESAKTDLPSIDYIVMHGRLAGNELVRSVLASHVAGSQIVVVNSERAGAFGAALHASVLDGTHAFPKLEDKLAAL